MEALQHLLQGLLCHLSGGYRDADLKVLALIAHIQEILKAAALLRHALLVQKGIALLGHALKLAGNLRHIFRHTIQHHGPGQVKFGIRQQQPKAAQSAGVRRNQDFFHSQLLGHFTGMEGSRSAKGH